MNRYIDIYGGVKDTSGQVPEANRREKGCTTFFGPVNKEPFKCLNLCSQRQSVKTLPLHILLIDNSYLFTKYYNHI
jgi:hypothetical protein|tara:strand:- start:10710 stop:10937 length:228 start_codon:yes stop_codon:yes gene_type:complete